MRKFITVLAILLAAALAVPAQETDAGRFEFIDAADEFEAIDAADELEVIDAAEEVFEIDIDPFISATASGEPRSAAPEEKRRHILADISGGYNRTVFDNAVSGSEGHFGLGAAGFWNLSEHNIFGFAAGFGYASGAFKNDDNGTEITLSGTSIFVAPVYRWGSMSIYAEAALPINIPLAYNEVRKAPGLDDEEIKPETEIGVAVELNGRYKFIGAGVGISLIGGGGSVVPINIRAYIPISRNIELVVPSITYCAGDGWYAVTVSAGGRLMF